MYKYNMKKIDVDSLVSFTEKWYKNMKAEKIPLERTWFDKTIDQIVQYLKVNSSFVDFCHF
jgi:hypothetical protein